LAVVTAVLVAAASSSTAVWVTRAAASTEALTPVTSLFISAVQAFKRAVTPILKVVDAE